MIIVSVVSAVLGWILGYLFHKWFCAPIKAGELFFFDGESGEPATIAAGLDIPVEEVEKHDCVTFKVHSRR